MTYVKTKVAVFGVLMLAGWLASEGVLSLGLQTNLVAIPNSETNFFVGFDWDTNSQTADRIFESTNANLEGPFTFDTSTAIAETPNFYDVEWLANGEPICRLQLRTNIETVLVTITNQVVRVIANGKTNDVLVKRLGFDFKEK